MSSESFTPNEYADNTGMIFDNLYQTKLPVDHELLENPDISKLEPINISDVPEDNSQAFQIIGKDGKVIGILSRNVDGEWVRDSY